MPKIIDAFLFFQELDLLEIRLNYLYEHVDNFVILEAVQTFSGKPKPLVFKENIHRFEKYLDKIIYYTVEDTHQNYESVRKWLKGKKSQTFDTVLRILDGHNHYNKKQLHWVLDTYHREMLHAPLDECASDDDVVMFSDLDEIPSHSAIKEIRLSTLQQPVALKQEEFKYFANFYSNSDWIGGIAAPYRLIKELSFNELRMDSKLRREIVAKTLIENAGYHFTSCGGIELLQSKIESWGHQEFNTQYIRDNLYTNVMSGKDIFGRESGTVLTPVEINDPNYFDASISCILSGYPDLVGPTKLETVSKWHPMEILRVARITFDKAVGKLTAK